MLAGEDSQSSPISLVVLSQGHLFMPVATWFLKIISHYCCVFQALCMLSMASFWKQCQEGMWARNRPSQNTEIGVVAFPRELSHRNQQLPRMANVLILLLLFLKKDFKWGFLFPSRWHPSWVTQNSNSNTGPMSSLRTKLFVQSQHHKSTLLLAQ